MAFPGAVREALQLSTSVTGGDEEGISYGTSVSDTGDTTLGSSAQASEKAPSPGEQPRPDDTIHQQYQFALQVTDTHSTVTIRVKDQTGEETFFKVKLSTKMSKVFDAYASRKGVRANALRFLLDGERINAGQTPLQLESRAAHRGHTRSLPLGHGSPQSGAVREARGCSGDPALRSHDISLWSDRSNG